MRIKEIKNDYSGVSLDELREELAQTVAEISALEAEIERDRHYPATRHDPYNDTDDRLERAKIWRSVVRSAIADVTLREMFPAEIPQGKVVYGIYEYNGETQTIKLGRWLGNDPTDGARARNLYYTAWGYNLQGLEVREKEEERAWWEEL